jgi:hypothetical protein
MVSVEICSRDIQYVQFHWLLWWGLEAGRAVDIPTIGIDGLDVLKVYGKKGKGEKKTGENVPKPSSRE